MIKFLMTTLIIFSATGCQGFMQKWQKDRLLNHLVKINNYHGMITETGVLDAKEDLVSEVWFQSPGKYSVIIREPKKHAGIQMNYDGPNLEIYYPQSKFAIVYKNLPTLNQADATKLVEDAFDKNVKEYIYELGPKSKIADLPVVELTYKAKSENTFVTSGKSFIYDEYSFPMRSEVLFRKNINYANYFKSIQFNADKFSMPKISIPKDAIVSDWDYNSKSLTEAEAKAAAGFKFQLPKDLPSGLKLTKIIRQKGPIPAFTAIYENRPYSLSIIVTRDYGINAVPTGRGIKLPVGKVNGFFIPNPHVNSYSFILGETQYVLNGNLTPAELIDAVSKIPVN